MTFDAVEFLQNLVRESSRPDGQDITPDQLPAEWHFLWDERAAIMEYDAGLTRERAEAEALKDVLDQIRRQGILPGSTNS